MRNAIQLYPKLPKYHLDRRWLVGYRLPHMEHHVRGYRTLWGARFAAWWHYRGEGEVFLRDTAAAR